MLVDNKDKAAVTESDLDKLVRDARGTLDAGRHFGGTG
jgi:hypothetical protein